MMMKNLVIGVTGLNLTDSPAPGLAVMRCIREVRACKSEGIGFGYDTFDAGLYDESFFKHVYLLPYPSEGSECLLNRILEVHKKTPLNVIIPTLDAELYNFISIKDDLHENGIMTFFPTKEQFEMCSKINLYSFGKKAGISVPETIVEKQINKVGMAVEKIGFPLMVKGIFYEAYKSHNIDEVHKYIGKITSQWGMPVIFQEYLEGVELNVAALGDGKGGYIGFIPMRKLIITDKGKGWAGVTIKDSGISGLVNRFFSATKWRGPIELEIIKTKDTAEYYLVEVNNRFPAWIYLSKAAGMNLPWLTVKLALGEKVRRKHDYNIGVIFNRCTADLILNMKKLETINVKGELHHE